MTRKVVYSVLTVAFLVFGTYMYRRGASDGVAAYKNSKQLALALESSYHFGFMDGLDKCHAPADDGCGHEDEKQISCSNCGVAPLCVANITEQDIQDIATRLSDEHTHFTVTGLPHQERWTTLDGKPCN